MTVAQLEGKTLSDDEKKLQKFRQEYERRENDLEPNR
jgi:hypothetical protein